MESYIILEAKATRAELHSVLVAPSSWPRVASGVESVLSTLSVSASEARQRERARADRSSVLPLSS